MKLPIIYFYTMKLSSLLLSFTLMTMLSIDSYGQKNIEADKKEVQQLIIDLFDGMREGDSAKVSNLFRKYARMFTSYKKQTGEEIIHEGDLKGFLKAIGTPHDEIWDERISNTVIQVDGNLAQVWTDYSFFVGDEFSHCGVDAFHILRENKIWRIINLMDTRKKEGCQ